MEGGGAYSAAKRGRGEVLKYHGFARRHGSKGCLEEVVRGQRPTYRFLLMRIRNPNIYIILDLDLCIFLQNCWSIMPVALCIVEKDIIHD